MGRSGTDHGAALLDPFRGTYTSPEEPLVDRSTLASRGLRRTDFISRACCLNRRATPSGSEKQFSICPSHTACPAGHRLTAPHTSTASFRSRASAAGVAIACLVGRKEASSSSALSQGLCGCGPRNASPGPKKGAVDTVTKGRVRVRKCGFCNGAGHFHPIDEGALPIRLRAWT